MTVSAVETGTLLKPSRGPLPMLAQPARAEAPASGASSWLTAALRPPCSTVRRLNAEIVWMSGLEEQLLFSMLEKSLAMISLYRGEMKNAGQATGPAPVFKAAR